MLHSGACASSALTRYSCIDRDPNDVTKSKHQRADIRKIELAQCGMTTPGMVSPYRRYTCVRESFSLRRIGDRLGQHFRPGKEIGHRMGDPYSHPGMITPYTSRRLIVQRAYTDTRSDKLRTEHSYEADNSFSDRRRTEPTVQTSGSPGNAS